MTIVLLIIVLAIPSLREKYFCSQKSGKSIFIKQRIFSFDFIKGIAMLAVIFIHTLLLFKLFHKGDEYVIFIANNLLRYAVPVFLIITGILLNPTSVTDQKSIIKFYIKKILFIFLPYLLMTLIVALYFQSSISNFFYLLFTGKAQAPYYYIVVLLQLYLIYPFLIRLNRNWLLWGSFLVSVVSFFLKSTWNLYDVPLFFPYVYYFAYGIARRNDYLKKHVKQIFNWNILIVIVAYLVFIVVRPEYYFNMVYIYGIAVWEILYGVSNKLKESWITRPVALIGRMSLWIFFVHFFIVMLMYQIFSSGNVLISIVVIYITATILSFFIAKLLNKIAMNIQLS